MVQVRSQNGAREIELVECWTKIKLVELVRRHISNCSDWTCFLKSKLVDFELLLILLWIIKLDWLKVVFQTTQEIITNMDKLISKKGKKLS
jgi:hypothetical protein